MLDELMLRPEEFNARRVEVPKGICSIDKPLSFITGLIKKGKLDFHTRNKVIVPYLSVGSTIEPQRFNAFADAYISLLVNSEAYFEFGSQKVPEALKELSAICVFADVFGIEHRINWEYDVLELFRQPSNYGPAMRLFSQYVKQEGRLLVDMLVINDTVN